MVLFGAIHFLPLLLCLFVAVPNVSLEWGLKVDIEIHTSVLSDQDALLPSGLWCFHTLFKTWFGTAFFCLCGEVRRVYHEDIIESANHFKSVGIVSFSISSNLFTCNIVTYISCLTLGIHPPCASSPLQGSEYLPLGPDKAALSGNRFHR